LAGAYTVQVTVDGCQGPLSNNFPFLVTSTQEDLNQEINLFPTPSYDVVSLRGLSSNPSYIKIINTTGQQQSIEFKKEGDIYTANLSSLSSGLYIVLVGIQDQRYYSKLIKY